MLARHVSRRFAARELIGLKINLYTAAEVSGLALALADGLAQAPVECLMVGDSYFTTHLGRDGTALTGPDEQARGLAVLVDRVAEVRAAVDALLAPGRLPYLMADLPDGAMDTPQAALRAAARFTDAGADVVKMEITHPGLMRCVEHVADAGVPVVAHLGYTPQRGSLSRHGDTVPHAVALFADARRVRDAGACALVLEMVSETVNRALSMPDLTSLPVYSVFSGSAPYGGQRLNVWDAVFRPPTPRRFFPPTAVFDAERDRERYTPEVIADRLGDLIRRTLADAFPPSPPTRLTVDERYELLASWPWRGGA